MLFIPNPAATHLVPYKRLPRRASPHVPNLLAEMGGKAEFQYNRPAAVRKVVVVSAVVGLGLLLWHQSKSRENDRRHGLHSGGPRHGRD